jgi:hypothetical protein
MLTKLNYEQSDRLRAAPPITLPSRLYSKTKNGSVLHPQVESKVAQAFVSSAITLLLN